MAKRLPTEEQITEFMDRLDGLDEDGLANGLQTDFIVTIPHCAARVQRINLAIETLTRINKGLIVRLALAEQREEIVADIKARTA